MSPSACPHGHEFGTDKAKFAGRPGLSDHVIVSRPAYRQTAHDVNPPEEEPIIEDRPTGICRYRLLVVCFMSAIGLVLLTSNKRAAIIRPTSPPALEGPDSFVIGDS